MINRVSSNNGQGYQISKKSQSKNSSSNPGIDTQDTFSPQNSVEKEKDQLYDKWLSKSNDRTKLEKQAGLSKNINGIPKTSNPFLDTQAVKKDNGKIDMQATKNKLYKAVHSTSGNAPKMSRDTKKLYGGGAYYNT